MLTFGLFTQVGERDVQNLQEGVCGDLVVGAPARRGARDDSVVPEIDELVNALLNPRVAPAVGCVSSRTEARTVGPGWTGGRLLTCSAGEGSPRTPGSGIVSCRGECGGAGAGAAVFRCRCPAVWALLRASVSFRCANWRRSLKSSRSMTLCGGVFRLWCMPVRRNS